MDRYRSAYSVSCLLLLTITIFNTQSNIEETNYLLSSMQDALKLREEVDGVIGIH